MIMDSMQKKNEVAFKSIRGFSNNNDENNE
jgi:hypothetical protein